MPISRAFAYNNGEPIFGLTQVGNLAISGTSFSGLTSSLTWYNGPDESLGYVVAYESLGNTVPGDGPLARVQFWRSSTQSDVTFISLSQYISKRHGSPQTFTSATQASSWLITNGYWNSYTVSSTLGTLANPAVSAQAIYNSGQTTNGWYYIQTSNMTSPKQIYCNMTDEGGGWMLMTYNPNTTTTGGTPYPNQWIGGTGSFASMVSIDTRQVWYHNGSAQCTQVMKMATSTTASLTPILNNMQIANKVVYANPNNLRLTATFSSSSAVFANNTPMTGTWSGVKGHTLMSTSLAVNAPGDWVYAVSGQWWTVCGPSTQLSVDGRSGNAQGSGSWTNNSNSSIYGMANVAATTNSLRTDIRTYAVYIK